MAIVLNATSADGIAGSQSATLDRIRVSQGTRAFYAAQGGSYGVTAGSPVEIWVEGSVSTGVPARLIIDWGDGQTENIHCGPCKLSHVYTTAVRRTVAVTLDDRVSATERWTFTLDVASSGVNPLRLVFTAPVPSSVVVPIGTTVPLGVEALYTKDVPVTLTCSIVCTAGTVCNIGIPVAPGVGRVFTPAGLGVTAVAAITAEFRCAASAEDEAASGVRVITWQ